MNSTIQVTKRLSVWTGRLVFKKTNINVDIYLTNLYFLSWHYVKQYGSRFLFEFTDGYERKHKAWSGIEEVPYCFSRSSVQFLQWRCRYSNVIYNASILWIRHFKKMLFQLRNIGELLVLHFIVDLRRFYSCKKSVCFRFIGMAYYVHYTLWCRSMAKVRNTLLI